MAKVIKVRMVLPPIKRVPSPGLPWIPNYISLLKSNGMLLWMEALKKPNEPGYLFCFFPLHLIALAFLVLGDQGNPRWTRVSCLIPM